MQPQILYILQKIKLCSVDYSPSFDGAALIVTRTKQANNTDLMVLAEVKQI